VGGTLVSLADGGTNANLTPDHGGLVYSTATGLGIIPPATAGTLYRSSGPGSAPVSTTAIYPDNAALGNILYGDASSNIDTLPGNTTTTKMFLSQTGNGVISAVPVWEVIDGSDINGQALTRVNDTNVTLTLGGTPTTALLQATSITAGWTGQLAMTRGGSGKSLTASAGGIVWTDADSMEVLAGTATANRMLLSGASVTPSWSTSTIPTSAGATARRWLRSDGTNYILSTPTLTETATSGSYIRGDGTNWITSTLLLPNAATTGDILMATSSNTVAALADVATGNAIISGGVGVAPSYGKIGLTTHISGTLGVGNGGTGTATTFTAGSVVFAGASGIYTQDNTNFFWNDSSNILSLGTASPPTSNAGRLYISASGFNANIRMSDSETNVTTDPPLGTSAND